MSHSLQVMSVSGEAIRQYIPDLARLRIEVFREFPYLYDGELAYEKRYLESFSQSARSVIVLALDEGKVVGASTGLPLADETPQFTQPFVEHGYDVQRIFYFAESVLRRPYRGGGAGSVFFDHREAHVRVLGGFDYCCFAAVDRPEDHPRRPSGYVPLDAFWTRRGYQRHPELRTLYGWKDLDEEAESDKPMTFWLKRLAPG